jgi:hypothetical protein
MFVTWQGRAWMVAETRDHVIVGRHAGRTKQIHVNGCLPAYGPARHLIDALEKIGCRRVLVQPGILSDMDEDEYLWTVRADGKQVIIIGSAAFWFTRTGLFEECINAPD